MRGSWSRKTPQRKSLASVKERTTAKPSGKAIRVSITPVSESSTPAGR